ncbi:hypothetical protein [Stieleria varia]|uniref:4Fe-4S ferredoxin-type domain-containing protein n=1 Tax=Stieleria varia TaxID=2528005 RepID=A0A5C5ZWU6_9BACT|nr:hypothetical protein [Stieleria varia]TWT91498.1 hypothetical protein Pla52n_65890 [Stieleria varia]
MSLKKLTLASALFALTLCMGVASTATAGQLLDQTGCQCCPVCDHVCKLDAEEIEVEKTCFKVESKAICIPRVVFPWQKAKKQQCASCDSCSGRGCTACVHNGARVRKVCVLKTEKYKCPACKYTWSAEKKDTCGGCCGNASCDGDCGHACDSGYSVPVAPDSIMQEPTMEAPVAPVPAVEHHEYGLEPVSLEPTPVATP